MWREMLIALSFFEHFLPVFQAFLRRFEFRKPAAFLLDEEEFEAAHGFRGRHKLLPRRHSLAKQDAIALILAAPAWRPILQMHDFDAPRVGLDPGDRIGDGY